MLTHMTPDNIVRFSSFYCDPHLGVLMYTCSRGASVATDGSDQGDVDRVETG